jgi:ParB family chromosome partitioning protein
LKTHYGYDHDHGQAVRLDGNRWQQEDDGLILDCSARTLEALEGTRVRPGHRRALAAVDAGRATVPVVILAEEADGTEADIHRLLSQRPESTDRPA